MRLPGLGGFLASLCRVSDYSGEKVTINDPWIEAFIRSSLFLEYAKNAVANAFLFTNAMLRPLCAKVDLLAARACRIAATWRTGSIRRRMKLFSSKKEENLQRPVRFIRTAVPPLDPPVTPFSPA